MLKPILLDIAQTGARQPSFDASNGVVRRNASGEVGYRLIASVSLETAPESVRRPLQAASHKPLGRSQACNWRQVNCYKFDIYKGRVFKGYKPESLKIIAANDGDRRVAA